MQELKELVLSLCNTPGTPGDEQAVFEVAKEALSFCKWVETDSLCGVHGFLGDENAPIQIMLDGHIDQIGMVITEIDEGGFLRLTTVGGIDRRTMPGARVTVYGRRPSPVSFAPCPPTSARGTARSPPSPSRRWISA
ncbi:MAG: hypothetical protein IJF34_10765 [Clostridia bacterium]|nr:hypothetical protein [Clostridia bacterium]